MCSEPLVMNLDIRVFGFMSMKVKLISFIYKPFDRYIDPWHRVLVLVIFDGINLSTASSKPVLNMTNITLTDI